MTLLPSLGAVAHIRVIDEDEAKGKLFELYDDIQRNRGRVSNILRSQSLDPKAMRAHLDLYMTTVFGKGGLSRKETELLAVAVSAANGDAYCVTHHREALSRYSEDGAWVQEVARDPRKAKLAPRDHALVEFALALSQSPPKAGKAHVEALRKAGLKDEEILQATEIVAYFSFANRLSLALGVELEAEADRDYVY